MKESNLFGKGKPANTLTALVVFSSAIKYVELSEHLERHNIKTTTEPDNNHDLVLALLSHKDIEAYKSVDDSDAIESFYLVDKTNKQVLIVIEGDSEVSGDVQYLQELNKQAKLLGGVNSSTLTFPKSITYPDYLACGISKVVLKDDGRQYLQLHNLLLTDNGGVIEEYEAL